MMAFLGGVLEYLIVFAFFAGQWELLKYLVRKYKEVGNDEK